MSTVAKVLPKRIFNSAIALSLIVAASVASGSEKKPRILLVSPEQSGVLQTGGLAHATGDLAVSLNNEGYRTDVLMPHFTNMSVKEVSETNEKFFVDLDFQNGQPRKRAQFTLVEEKNGRGAPTLFLRHDSAPSEVNYFENSNEGKAPKSYAPDFRIGESFAALAKAQAEYILSRNYDIVILNDWTAGLVALHLRDARERGVVTPKVMFAIHNLAYQGLFPIELADYMGLDRKNYALDGYEFHGRMSFLKAGLQYSDMIYTVSPQYASEIATDRFGAGLDGLIREKAAQGKMTGILNGIVNTKWDPSIPQKDLDHTFSSENMTGKAVGKAELQRSLGLPERSNVPVFVLTSRLAEQKGFEYLIGAIKRMNEKSEAQWIVIGNGEKNYSDLLQELERRFPDKVRYKPFSDSLEKKLMRYGDFFVNGAWFEPSGLNQFFALKNGTIPVVSAAGGLLNSVEDGKTGLLFSIAPGDGHQPYDIAHTEASALSAFERAEKVFANKIALYRIRKAGMKQDHSWTGRIRENFEPLFDKVLGRQNTSRGESCRALFLVK